MATCAKSSECRHAGLLCRGGRNIVNDKRAGAPMVTVGSAMKMPHGSKFPPSRSGSLKVYMAGLLRSLFRGQQHSSGWIFHGAFAALARGPRRGATDQDAVALLKWAETYRNRQMPSSFAGHSRMFANFASTKFRLETRNRRLYCSLTYVLATQSKKLGRS